DEARVRKVVDAFRAPGCNFLAPGFDPANPRPLTSDTIVDISHESLIRQWKQLSEWVEAEGRARRQWQRLRDRFDDKQPLQGPELTTTEAWRSAGARGATLPWWSIQALVAAACRRSDPSGAAIAGEHALPLRPTPTIASTAGSGSRG